MASKYCKKREKNEKEANFAMEQIELSTQPGMPIDKHPTGAVNSLYSQISAFNAPLAYDDEINDIYEWLFLDSGSSVEHSKTHTCPRATATYIFPQGISGQTAKKWRDQCINMWLDNCNKAFDTANRGFSPTSRSGR